MFHRVSDKPPNVHFSSKGKRPQGIKKGQKPNPLRRSARLDCLIEINETQKPSKQSLPSPVSDDKRLHRAQPPPTHLPSKPSKRKREAEQQLNPPSPKRPQTSCPRPSVQDVDSVTYWTQTYHWPRGYFNECGEMSHLLARKKSTASLRRKRSDSESGTPSSTTPSDQKPREEKSAPYQDPRYRSLLEAKGSFMGKYIGRNEEGPTAESKKEYKSLLEAEQAVPEHDHFALLDPCLWKARLQHKPRQTPFEVWQALSTIALASFKPSFLEHVSSKPCRYE
ncbi:uncharacterized protein Z518_04928 [Rhinocladiella mackenziei CBS 650.93]|uniref:Uncharacterized protein n=1 Tax=Rhinocladiella mackenziei CBS 650.93 TaxID=1442369 RepID=A0A0D2FXA2_9EURO|nr:uncharacterized protein Z518_04928 [Rhinocladiella mackenziei CBS 650.93]KIX06952.1 hypothetical protein Z518_04928 [Rhinocladiella mackenziei CBS 650.93]